MVNGMLAVADMNDFAPDVILSANCSVLVEMARQLPSSREAIANALRGVLQIIESGEFPVADQVIGQQPAPGTKLH